MATTAHHHDRDDARANLPERIFAKTEYTMIGLGAFLLLALGLFAATFAAVMVILALLTE